MPGDNHRTGLHKKNGFALSLFIIAQIRKNLNQLYIPEK
jgi:hypothetical protein